MTDPDRTRHRTEDDDLRALLEDAVADVRPAPALDRIRARTKVTPMNRTRPWLLVTAGAVAATAATITAVALADGGAPQADPSPGPAATATGTPSSEPSTDPTPTPTDGDPTPSQAPSGDPSDGGSSGGAALPVYFVGDTPTGPRLFREFRPAPAGTSGESSARVLAAIDLAVTGSAADPDYRSGWPSGVAADGAGQTGDSEGDVQVALDSDTDLAVRPAAMSGAEAEIAVQQLVYTAQAVLQQRVPVVFTDGDGTALTRLLGVDVTDGVREAPALEVQAPVWVISPQDGEEVGRTFTVEGRGAFFEANVSWQLLGPDGTPVDEGFATARECCTLAPYSFEVTAAPGEYVLRVYDADVSDGEGPGEQQDTKRITVR